MVSKERCLYDGIERFPCSHCGSTDLEYAHSDDGYSVIVCHGCGAVGPHAMNKEDAIRMWNLRGPELALRTEIGGLEKYVQSLEELILQIQREK